MFQSLSLVGRLGTDPEMRYTPTGTPVTNFSVATDVGYGENKKTVWFKATAWRKTAEIANQYLAKGDTVAIQGEVGLETYTTNSGESRANLTVTINHLSFVNTQGKGQQSSSGSGEAVAANRDASDLPW